MFYDAWFLRVLRLRDNYDMVHRKRANAARCAQKVALLFFYSLITRVRVISHELPGFVSVDYFVIAQMSPVFPMRVGGDFKICKRPQRSYDTQRDHVPHPPLNALFVSHPPEFPL